MVGIDGHIWIGEFDGQTRAGCALRRRLDRLPGPALSQAGEFHAGATDGRNL